MEPISMFLLSAAGYVLKAAANSKTAETAKEKILEKFWRWVKPYFIEAVPEIEESPDNPETEIKLQEQLLELIKNESFYNELLQKISTLREAGIKEKNIVKKDIERVKKIRIGDKEFFPSDSYYRKNIVEGNVKDADDFILGDGH